MGKIDYTKQSLVATERALSTHSSRITLNGKDLSLSDIHSVTQKNTSVAFSDNSSLVARMHKSHGVMLEDIKTGKPVYGSNSSFGGQAGRVLNKGDIAKRLKNARGLSEGLVFLDVSTGPHVSDGMVRAAMLVRLNMLLAGVSAVRLETLDIFRRMLNEHLIPVVNLYGGIGASGDLAHNQRVVSAARGLPGTFVLNEHGKTELASKALQRHHIPLLKLDPKEGLGLVNGDNFSTAFANEICYRLIQYLLVSTVVGAMAIEVLRGSDRSFHPLLSAVRPHPGQKEVADMYRSLLGHSKLAYQELKGHAMRPDGIKVQDGYSLRCIPQFEGVMVEEIKHILNTITINANSVSDNPLWVPEEYVTPGEKPWQWVSGGNFLAMHMAEAMDKMRKIMTQLVKRNDRHLARMIDEHENNGLTANLSDPLRSITQCTFKGVQIQSGMFEVYSMILATPVTTLFGTHEERNQDVTAHALTSGILGLQNLEILKYSIASNMLAVAQGIDLRGGRELLSPKTKPMYDCIRKFTETVHEDRPLHTDIERLADAIENGPVMDVVRKEVFTS